MYLLCSVDFVGWFWKRLWRGGRNRTGVDGFAIRVLSSNLKALMPLPTGIANLDENNNFDAIGGLYQWGANILIILALWR